MDYRAECECGWSTMGSKDEVVRDGQAPGLEVHGFEPTADQILALARPVEAD